LRVLARRRAFLLFAVALFACGLSKIGTGENGEGPDAGDAATKVGEGGVVADGGAQPDAGAADAAVPELPIYGVTLTSLYRFHPDTLTLTNVGLLAGCLNITDIALDATGKMYATGTGLYTIDTSTGACTAVSAVPQPFTLTALPSGALHAGTESLVAFLGSDYVEVNVATGVVTQVKSQAINQYQPSGDVVAEVDAGMFVSVTDPTCSTDCILSVRPTDGTIVKNWGPSGSTAVLGLAMSRGALYGFLGKGDIVRFTFAAGKVTSTVLPLTEKPVWIGAGSRTTQ
jgi:hypothetical protein